MKVRHSRDEWKRLHSKWLAADTLASKLEREMMTALRLSVESRAEPPTHELIEALTQARGHAVVCRNALDFFVDELLR
ncbi:MAG: hypothetical protein Q7T70_09015 [Polaromonas sp.]|nr:hypothetical protein [Polaromonas sp.]